MHICMFFTLGDILVGKVAIFASSVTKISSKHIGTGSFNYTGPMNNYYHRLKYHPVPAFCN